MLQPQRVFVLASLVACSARASAQFDSAWVTFAPDNTRLVNPGGSPATHVFTDDVEKDMASGDLDRDGWIDLVIVRKERNTTTGAFPNFLLMNENGVLVDQSAQYASAADVPGDLGFLTPTNDRDVVIADLNNDGWLDVVTATTRAAGQPKHISHPRVYMNLGFAGGAWLGLRFENNRIPTFSISPNFCGVAAGDVTGDGFADLYFTNYDGEGPDGSPELYDRLLINDGTGHFTDSGFTRLTQTMLDARFGVSVQIVDMNLDGKLDIVRASGVTGTGPGSVVTVAYNNPSNVGYFPTFMYQAQVGSDGPYHADVGDLNNDNRPDLIFSDRNPDGFRFNTGVDALGRVIWSTLRHYTYVTGADDGIAGTNLIADLDGDGWKDTLHCDYDPDVPGCIRRMHIFHNLGGAPGGSVVLREEAGSAGNPWRGAVGLFANDLIGTFDTAAFDIDNDGDVDLVIGRCTGTFVWLNQQVQGAAVTTFCAGDGSSAACPCGSGALGNGCPSSISPAGARLAGLGTARIAADSLVLRNTLVENGPGLFFQGTGETDVPFGDGKLCAGVGITRLGVVFATGGTAYYPGGFTPSPIHVAGGVQAGDVRVYQVWYRDSAVNFCTSATFNLTNGVRVTWLP
ncbi:MAG: VCBS repeat-containing protein [Planctomycetes bacterium]|nr:VCBS repeat-containing protein [Planctomycetota bacterium]